MEPQEKKGFFRGLLDKISGVESAEAPPEAPEVPEQQEVTVEEPAQAIAVLEAAGFDATQALSMHAIDAPPEPLFEMTRLALLALRRGTEYFDLP